MIRDHHLNKQGEMSPKNIRWRIKEDTTSRTLSEDDFGCLITNRGASATVTWTLPSPANKWKGAWIIFYAVANSNIIVAGAATDIVALNTTGAADIRYATVRIGGGFELVCDGTKWLAMPHHWDNAATTQPITITP